MVVRWMLNGENDNNELKIGMEMGDFEGKG
jgi:hypothetical protein